MEPEDGRRRVVIEAVRPQVDGGRFPVKRVVGERLTVEADVFADGHDALACRLLYRHEGDAAWTASPMEPTENDRWRGGFVPDRLGVYRYTLEAWVDRFHTWRLGIEKKLAAGQGVSLELAAGAGLVAAAAGRARLADARRLRAWAEALAAASEAEGGGPDLGELVPEPLVDLMAACADRGLATLYQPELPLVVDRERARSASWYELFPRSCSPEPGRHGTLADCEARLPYVAAMGFDVLYLPPIHPIGRTDRKGKNNVGGAGPEDPGSPWAIGAAEGGHRAVHPQLGTLADFRRLVARAREHGIEVALDLAFQCSPDHPYVREHPEWFRHRPDGSIQFAENPPKKYQDIFPLDFECEGWRELWAELKGVVLFWIKQGVAIFRVDNPHTKPLGFWEWLIAEVKREHPETIFLAEAFTRPKLMYRLAKVGFTQSYTYFAWRNAKWELEQYFTELVQTEVREFFRPNLWPNTPDILTAYLQTGGRPAFMARLVLAATLGASYGIYGPVFELCESQPLAPGSEEYLHSDKYELRWRELERPQSLAPFIARVNRIRRDNPALQSDASLRFHPLDNERLIGYSKSTDDCADVVLTVVNLDPHYTQSGWIELPLEALRIDPGEPYQVHDLLTDARYTWRGPRNYVELNPHAVPAHIFRVRRRVHGEPDFDHYA